jgi:hypothetical protein
MYAYRSKFTGEGVFMHKEKDGGIACQKWPCSVWPIPWPDHLAVDRASPAEQPDCYSEQFFGGLPGKTGPGAEPLSGRPDRFSRPAKLVF